MSADCSFFLSSTAVTVCAPFCTTNGSGFRILALKNSFSDSFPADFLRGWQCIARSSACQRLSRFVRRIALQMVADSLFYRSSMAFTVRAPFYSADDSTLLILSFINGFLGLRAVFPNGWQRIAHYSTRQRLS